MDKTLLFRAGCREMASRMSLADVPQGRRIRVVDIERGGYRIQKILDMGLTPGVEAFVRQNRFKGPIVVDVRGVSLVIGRDFAEGILVELL